ncbi:MAG: NADH-quinone oxidoreductase subunit J [Anaerolineae bacterium]
MELVLFLILATIAVISALAVILARNLVHAVLFMVVNFTAVSILYLLLNAPFIAVVQVAVYAGAIMVLFLFVVMLMGPQKATLTERLAGQRPLALILAVVLLGGLGSVVAVNALRGTPGPFTPEQVSQVGNPQLIGQLLFTDYLFPFEIASVLLLVAMVGAVVLAKRK